MRRVFIPVLFAAAVTPGLAAARDADSILRGSLIDALVDFKEDKADKPHSPSVRQERGPATTNPARPRRSSATDDITQGPRAIPSRARDDDDADEDDDDDKGEAKSKDGKTSGKKDAEANGKSTSKTGGKDDEDDDAETSFDFAIRGGYDSNYDEFKGGKGSSFVEATTSGSVEKKINDDTTVYASADATYLRLSNLKGFRERPDGSVQTAIRHTLSETVAIQAGVEGGVDATDDPISASGAASLSVEALTSMGSFAVRGSFDTERAIASPSKDEDYKAYDYNRPTVEASALFLPDAKVSPIASVGVSRAMFPNKLSDDTDDDGNAIRQPNRDAVQVTAALGLRASLTDDLVVKLSGRMNRRDFGEKGLKSKTTFGPDVEASWSVGEDTTIEASFQRTLTESEVYGSLAEDISAFSLGVDYAPDKGFGVKVSGEFEHSRELGIKDVSDDITLEMVATYRVDKNRFFEVGLLRSWSIDQTGLFDSDRFKITAGGGYTF